LRNFSAALQQTDTLGRSLHMSLSQEYRTKAREFEALAAQMNGPKNRARLLERQKLAASMEDSEGESPAGRPLAADSRQTSRLRRRTRPRSTDEYCVSFEQREQRASVKGLPG
jgi:hypothetical protein